MANTYLVEIDLVRLVSHFTKADNRPWTTAEAKEWLRESGFIERRDDARLARSHGDSEQTSILNFNPAAVRLRP